MPEHFQIQYGKPAASLSRSIAEVSEMTLIFGFIVA